MKLPKHLAIIMDGNGRWAQARSKPRAFGHVKGTRVAKKIIEECARLKIPFLTLYAFSTENWLRPQGEVSVLMKLLKRYLQRELNTLIKENIRFHVIGNLGKLPPEVVATIKDAIQKTEHCTGLQLTFALSYGSRQEITNAVADIARMIELGELKSYQVTEALINSHLSTHFAPDPDLIVRTSGEMRLSNFLLWQAAYSEFYFSDVLWPDFTVHDLNMALDAFKSRQRRFGGIKAVLNEKFPS
ncbi:MAG: isoprenyl transferase [Bdellovibrionia bacterium]